MGNTKVAFQTMRHEGFCHEGYFEANVVELSVMLALRFYKMWIRQNTNKIIGSIKACRYFKTRMILASIKITNKILLAHTESLWQLVWVNYQAYQSVNMLNQKV